ERWFVLRFFSRIEVAQKEIGLRSHLWGKIAASVLRHFGDARIEQVLLPLRIVGLRAREQLEQGSPRRIRIVANPVRLEDRRDKILLEVTVALGLNGSIGGLLSPCQNLLENGFAIAPVRFGGFFRGDEYLIDFDGVEVRGHCKANEPH